MSEQLTNGGAESGLTGLSNVQRVTAVGAPEPVYAGAASFKLQNLKFAPIDDFGRAEWSGVTVEAGATYTLGMRVYRVGSPQQRPTLRVLNAGNTVALLSVMETLPGEWAAVSRVYKAKTSFTGRVRLFLGNRTSNGADLWYIDEVSLFKVVDVAKLNAVRSALETDIETVSNVVFSAPLLAEPERVDYSVVLRPGEGGNADDSSIKGLQVAQTYELSILRVGNSAETDVYDLLDALRDAIDVETSTVGALSYVNNATVRNWEKAQVTKDQAGNRARINATVEVVFHHARGDS